MVKGIELNPKWLNDSDSDVVQYFRFDFQSGWPGAPLVGAQPMGILSFNARFYVIKNQCGAPGQIRFP
jgi:hypothetical protein